MSRLTRDGTAEPVSRDQILRHARGQGNTIFPVQLTTSRIGNLTRLIHTLLDVMTIHTYIHTYKHTNNNAPHRKCLRKKATTCVGLLVFSRIRRDTFPYSVEDDASTISQTPTTHYTNTCVKLTIVTHLSFSERIAIANLSYTINTLWYGMVANPVREGRRSTRLRSWRQPATQTSSDPNRDKILARFNHPRTSETYRRQDDVLLRVYELQLLSSG